jgi:hypothetical protein
MAVLPGHRPEPSDLPEQPWQSFEASAHIDWQEMRGFRMNFAPNNSTMGATSSRENSL